jgi:hypothetical protein
VRAEHATLGAYYLYGKHAAEVLFTENETNAARLWGAPNASPFVKDAFHRYVIDGDLSAVNPDGIGTKAAARHTLNVAAGDRATISLVLSAAQLRLPPLASRTRSSRNVARKRWPSTTSCCPTPVLATGRSFASR